MKKLRIGVIGVGRGSSMMKFCQESDLAELVAICDKWVEGLENKKLELGAEAEHITFYTDYDTFLTHDMDVVVLANYANEHAPFACKAMRAGKHVISEVLPCQNMKEAVELIECIEETGLTYCYAENYCYMAAPREMRRVYRSGKLGQVEYAEGEYIHNCEPIWPEITYGERHHWRNIMYSNFYCTHSIGPLIHITGLRPVKVSGFEMPFNARAYRMGKRAGTAGVEMITLENGAVIRSTHSDLFRDSIWYSLYCADGHMESGRESAGSGTDQVYSEITPGPGDYAHREDKAYKPGELDEAASYGHGGSDYYTMLNAVKKIMGDPDAEAIDVFEALDMFLPGLFAYRSVLAGGQPMEIPDLRKKEVRDIWRNDTTCCDPKAAGDMYVPAYSKGEPEIPDSVYGHMRELWDVIWEERKFKP